MGWKPVAKRLPGMHGDVSQIRQVLMNLVINASEAIGDRSGSITVSTGAMDCSAEYLAHNYVAQDLAPRADGPVCCQDDRGF